MAFNPLCGGQRLDDIELRRNDEMYLDALGTESIPDPTTAGDFCRRFSSWDIHALMDAINETRLDVWRMQRPSFTEQTARIDADGTMVPTTGECKQGMDIGHKGIWGYHPLLVSFANTQEPLYITNRSASRPSYEGVVPLFDKAIALCREAGFADILLRGDTDFSLTSELDRWDEQGVRFVFGYFDYQPTQCSKTYRMVVVRKNLSVERGDWVLFPEVRHIFLHHQRPSPFEARSGQHRLPFLGLESLAARLLPAGRRPSLLSYRSVEPGHHALVIDGSVNHGRHAERHTSSKTNWSRRRRKGARLKCDQAPRQHPAPTRCPIPLLV